MHVKIVVTAGWFLTLFAFSAVRATACSQAACVNQGFETRPDFVVSVLHQERPIAGVTVQVTTSADGKEVRRFSSTTDIHGQVHVLSLPPGEYWLKAELLGIEAAYQCFHVADTPSKKARRRLTYDWGDLAPATRRITGKLIDCQPGSGGSHLMNLLHCVQVPVAGARFTLQNPMTGTTYVTTSDERGTFGFSTIPVGTYVLHVEGGKTPTRDYDSADLLVNLNPTARWDTLVLTRKDPGAGGCGGTSLDLITNTER